MSLILSYLVSRLKEPSTYAGLAGLLGAFGLHVSADQLNPIIGILTAVASAVAIFVPG